MKAALILMAFSAGLLAGFAFGNMIAAGMILAVIIVLRIGIERIRRNPAKISSANRLLTLWSLSLMFSIGFLDTTIHPSSTFLPQEEQKYHVVGEVRERRTLATYERYTLKINSIDGIPEEGTVILYASPESVFRTGNLIAFSSTLKRHDRSRFADKAYSAVEFNPGGIYVVGMNSGIGLRLRQLRDEIRILIEYSSLGEESRALLKALVTADRSELDEERLQEFRNSGVIHVLAVSGMHIGIISMLLLFVTRPLVLVTGRKLRYAIVIAGVWAFVLLTGAAFSTVRAALMLTMAGTAWILERHREAFSATCYAALLILIFRPAAMFDPGLQLSFVSVASLTLFAERLNFIDHRSHPVTYKICALILTTLIATSATWILTGFHFGSVALRFLPANMIILPLLPAYMVAGILYLMLVAVGIDLEMLAGLLEWVPNVLYVVLDRISTDSLNVEIGGSSLALWMAGIVALAIALHKDSDWMAVDNTLCPRVAKINVKWMVAASLLFIASLAILPFRI